MMGQFVITLREGFEAALLVAILVAYLRRSGKTAEVRYAYTGALIAIVLGLIAALGLVLTAGALGEEQKVLFEGAASYLAVAVLTYMIVWMSGKNVREEIESRASSRIRWGIAAIAFVFVVREVFETVLFLTPYATRDALGTLAGAGAGIAAALLLSLAVFRLEYRMDMRRFFYVTGILLAFIASGLAGYGTHELIEFAEEKGYKSWLFEEAYALGIDASNPLHHKGAVGSVLAVMFGYSASMEWLRVFVQFGYLLVTLLLIHRRYSASKVRAERPTPSF
ncbi:FTR1 family protein [Geoglobus ahangari]